MKIQHNSEGVVIVRRLMRPIIIIGLMRRDSIIESAIFGNIRTQVNHAKGKKRTKMVNNYGFTDQRQFEC